MTLNVVEKKPLIGKKHRLIIKGRNFSSKPCIRCYTENLEDTQEILVTSFTRVHTNRLDVFLNVKKAGNYYIVIDGTTINVRVENDKPNFWWILIPLIPALIILFG